MVCSAAVFGDPISHQQFVGFVVTLMGMGLWSHMKLQERLFASRGLRTFLRFAAHVCHTHTHTHTRHITLGNKQKRICPGGIPNSNRLKPCFRNRSILRNLTKTNQNPLQQRLHANPSRTLVTALFIQTFPQP